MTAITFCALIFGWPLGLETKGQESKDEVRTIVLKHKVLYFPVLISPTERADIATLRLFVSSDRGRTWAVMQEANANDKSMRLALPADGEYWITLQVEYNDGRRTPKDVSKEHLSLKIRVKSEDPKSAAARLDAIKEFASNYHSAPVSGRVLHFLDLALKKNVLEHPLVKNKPHTLDLFAHAFGHMARGNAKLVRAVESRFATCPAAGRPMLLKCLRICGDNKTIEQMQAWAKHPQYRTLKTQLDNAYKFLADPRRKLPRDLPAKTREELDLLWADFLVTGEYGPVRRILDVLDEPTKTPTILRKVAAWSLASNLDQHPQLRKILAAKQGERPPTTSGMIQAWFVSFAKRYGASSVLTRAEAATALRKAVRFFREKVSIKGGYLWQYSPDLALREGEGKAGAETAWVQPPGTPTVGEAFLYAYRLTGDKYYLDAARETAHALVAGQLRSGGWDYRIEFNPRDRKRYAYRVAPAHPRGRNTTTLDDNTTQAALRFLMRFDQTVKFRDEKVRTAVKYGLESMLKAQYPNGAWPQRFSEFPDPKKYPVKKASYPKSWPRKYPKKDYRDYYTFNDNTIADVIDVMFLAAEIYSDKRYRDAAEKAGDFMILAQMPDPQPGWAQQYDRDMHPAWARRFEPASITGGEAQGVMRTLLKLYRKTGKKKYLEPIPRALAYYKKSLLPNGRLARFYELKTNRPLYFVKDTYELTYKSNNMPTHYGFIVGSRLGAINKEYRKLLKTDPARLDPPLKKPVYRMTARSAAQAKAVIAAMDERGAWVEPGSLRRAGKTNGKINCRTFVSNVETLARFIAASGK